MFLAQYWTVLSETCSVLFSSSSFAAWALHKVYPFSQNSFIIQLKLCPFILFLFYVSVLVLVFVKYGQDYEYSFICNVVYISCYFSEFISCWPGPACIFFCAAILYFSLISIPILLLLVGGADALNLQFLSKETGHVAGGMVQR